MGFFEYAADLFKQVKARKAILKAGIKVPETRELQTQVCMNNLLNGSTVHIEGQPIDAVAYIASCSDTDLRSLAEDFLLLEAFANDESLKLLEEKLTEKVKEFTKRA